MDDPKDKERDVEWLLIVCRDFSDQPVHVQRAIYRVGRYGVTPDEPTAQLAFNVRSFFRSLANAGVPGAAERLAEIEAAIAKWESRKRPAQATEETTTTDETEEAALPPPPPPAKRPRGRPRKYAPAQ